MPMKILVANLGSTSFKYRLFDMAADRVLAAEFEPVHASAAQRLPKPGFGRRQIFA